MCLNADRLGRKVLFVRIVAVGNQMLRMMANHRVPAVNVIAVLVRSYMNQLKMYKVVLEYLTEEKFRETNILTV